MDRMTNRATGPEVSAAIRRCVDAMSNEDASYRARADMTDARSESDTAWSTLVRLVGATDAETLLRAQAPMGGW